jgi:DNA-binding MarR family transcriptional regulator
VEEILEKFDTSYQQIHSKEEYTEMAKYLSDLAEGVGLDKRIVTRITT